MKRTSVVFCLLVTASALMLGGCQAPIVIDDEPLVVLPSEEPPPLVPSGPPIGVALLGQPPVSDSPRTASIGALLEDGLIRAGFTPLMAYAENPDQQKEQIQDMINQGAGTIIVTAVAGDSLGAVLKKAKKVGVTIIALERLLINTKRIDMFVGWDICVAGQLQAMSLLEGLQAKGSPPWNVELIAGASDDLNAKAFFRCAMKILKPKIDDGTLKVQSGQTTFKQAATAGWLPAEAAKRLTRIIDSHYQKGQKLDGVLVPSDVIVREIIPVVAAAMFNPVMTGLGATAESIQMIADGMQYSTLYYGQSALASNVVEIVLTLQQGEDVVFNDTKTYNNGVKVVPAFTLGPTLVTRDNLCQIFDPGSEAAQAAAATGRC